MFPDRSKPKDCGPLGRLVFADHFTKICDSIQRAIENIGQAENIATTAETIGINPAEKSIRAYSLSAPSAGVWKRNHS